VPLALLVDRVPSDGRRPLAADRARFEQLYETRRAGYRQAHYRLDAEQSPVPALVEQVMDYLDA